MKDKALMSAFLVVLLVITGCSMTTDRNERQNNNESLNNENLRYTDYYNARVQYVGDNSKVISLLNVLGVNDLGEYTIVLTTDKEPYGLTINYSELKDNLNENYFKDIEKIEYAFYLLSLVENLSFVDVNYKTHNYHLDIEKANKLINGEIKDYGSSPEKLIELNSKLNILN